MTGQTLGHYRILEKIGAGGMGEVYRARDDFLQRDVAIKTLHLGLLDDPTAKEKLLREARSSSALNDPHICTIYEVGELDGKAFIAMELVEGRSLNSLIPAEGMPVKLVVRYGTQIAAALAHAHDHGIVHRDVKTSNVVVTPSGLVKVLDFGLALQPCGNDLEDITRSQDSAAPLDSLTGTLPYMAPEVLRGREATARTDIWALGVVLYEMMMGKRPFKGHTAYELVSAILREAPAPLPASTPGVLKRIIGRCLEKETGHRYQRASEVVAALEAVQTEDASVPLATTGTGVSSRTRIAWLAGSVASLCLAGLLVLNVGGLRRRIFAPKSSGSIQSLAVLPLENLSHDPAQEYFADGMTDALITDLAKAGNFRVISRTSVMPYKAAKKTLPNIAQELGVDAVVEGSVLESGNRVRITAQLFDAKTDRHLWAENYERDVSDILSLQDEVANAIATAIPRTYPAAHSSQGPKTASEPGSLSAVSQGNVFLR